MMQKLDLKEGWNAVLPGIPTTCAHGTPFQFWVRPGSSDNLLIFLDGGGGCWSEETCREGSPWYNHYVEDNQIAYHQTGIFDLNNLQNPFRNYTYVYIPSCTGDVYMGAKKKSYSEEVTIYHHGFLNLQAALQFTFDKIRQPNSIFIVGCSAGSPGSALAAPYVIQHYPNTPVYQLGDSLGAIFHIPSDMEDVWGMQANLPPWIPDMPSANAFTMTAYYLALAKYYPNYRFGQYNSLYDHIQKDYFGAGQADPAAFLANTLNTMLSTIAHHAPNFRSYTADGTLHCITTNPEFYTHAVKGVRFIDWIAAYAQGEAVETIHCENCERIYQE